MRLALAGDLLITTDLRPLLAAGRLDALTRWLATADLTMGNLETVVHDYQFPPAARSGGTWLRAPAEILDQLVSLGVRAVAVANNHSCDFGTEGLMHTVERARDAGLLTAGGGRSLSAAARPATVGTESGTVHLVAATTTGPVEAQATDPDDTMPARPGIFRINTVEEIVLPDEPFEQLSAVARLLGCEVGIERLHLEGVTYRRGAMVDVVSRPDQHAVARLCEAVKTARISGGVVTVSVHSHEDDGSWDRPSGALRTLAHAAVDSGADVVWCHGAHLLRGVERRGRGIIFYSLGSLFFQTEGVDRQPVAARSDVDLPPEASMSELRSRKFDYLATPAHRESIVPVCTWRDDRPPQVRITPFIVEHRRGDQHGLPRATTPAESAVVADRLTKLSAGWGTEVRCTADGVLRLQP